MNAKTPLAREQAPSDRRIGAIEHVEDLVFLFQDALKRRSAEDKERLKFSQVQKPHHLINVRGRQEHAADRRV